MQSPENIFVDISEVVRLGSDRSGGKSNFHFFSQRSSRGLVIAKNYAKVSENELARDWLQRYLDIKPNDAAAHKFMGELYERLNKSEQAITSYQRAYTLNPKQSDLIKSSKFIARISLCYETDTDLPEF